jgi:hypothetical protein
MSCHEVASARWWWTHYDRDDDGSVACKAESVGRRAAGAQNRRSRRGVCFLKIDGGNGGSARKGPEAAHIGEDNGGSVGEREVRTERGVEERRQVDGVLDP